MSGDHLRNAPAEVLLSTDVGLPAAVITLRVGDIAVAKRNLLSQGVLWGKNAAGCGSSKPVLRLFDSVLKPFPSAICSTKGGVCM